jgi:hypothetical protein
MTTPALPFDDRFVDLSPSAGTTELDYDFELKSEAGLTVLRTRSGVRAQLVNGTDYDFLSGLGDKTGGTITLLSTSQDGDRYMLVGIEPIERASDLLDSNAFHAGRYNEEGDLFAIFDQEQRRDIDRAMKSDYGQAGLIIDTSAVTEGQALMRGPGDTIVPGPTATEITAAQGYAESASQSKTDAETAKTAAEIAQAAAEAATQFTHVMQSGLIDGVGPYDMTVPIGAEANLYLTIGNLPQAVGTYTISGTTFTLNSVDGIDGLPWEARVHGNVRALNAPADGSVGQDQLASGAVNSIITADMSPWNAVFDGSPADQAKIKAAALAAAAAGVPFVVPNKGFDTNEGLVINVPEDFATVQLAHDAMLNWIFPGVKPGNSATLPVPSNFDRKIAVTISVEDDEQLSSGVGVVWNHPSWQFIKLKGRGAAGLSLASFQQSTYTSGVHLTRIRFSTWPSPAPRVGAAMQILLPTGTALFGEGDVDQLEGIWRIHAVDSVNKDITLAVYSREMTSSFDIQSLTGGIYAYIPCGFRSINLPANGAQNAGIDVLSGLIAEDFYVSGEASGTNDSESNGIVMRYGSFIECYGFGGCLEWQRCGYWGLMGSDGQLGKWAFCGNISSGINCIEARLDGQYVTASGNLGHGVVIQTGGKASFPLGNFGGNGDTGVLVTNSGSIICSGKANKCDIGVDVKPGGFANIQDMQVRDCTTMGVRRRGGGRIMLTANNVDAFDPPLDSGDSYGGFTALSATLEAVT